MKRSVFRILPNGETTYVSPFHLSMHGLETAILCRDDLDYDAMVKILCICAPRKNVIIIIYAVVSNHCHVAVLAKSHAEAYEYGIEIKMMYSMWFRRRYNEPNVLANVDVKAILLDNDWYVRNALAYIPRNAIDNGCNVNDYKWSGFSAMFRKLNREGLTPVSSLKKQEKRVIMHTGDDLSNVPWLLDAEGHLVPASFCDHGYLEQAFNNNLAFFLKTIGTLNPAGMDYKLVESPREMQVDEEFLKAVNEISNRWFKCDVSALSIERKCRLIPFVYRTMKTTVPQLARAFGRDREEIARILKGR